MLFSYHQAADADLAQHTLRFVRAALQIDAPEGLVLGPQALKSYVGNLVGVQDLVDSVSDAESVARVDHELKRRFLTGRVPEDVTEALVEALEILGLDEELKVADIPLVAVLSADGMEEQHVIINVVGRKSLADAVRSLYARLYVHPYPESVPQASIILYRMPPLAGTARASLEDDHATIDAVRGWGLLVGTQEVADTYTLRKSGALVDKQVRAQDSMVYRNPRSGEVVQTRPRDAHSQKLTDDEARTMVLLTSRVGLDQAVFGFSDEKIWLLAVPSQQASLPSPEPADAPTEEEPADESVEPAASEDSEIVIVDLEGADEEPDQPVEDDPDDEPSEQRPAPHDHAGAYEEDESVTVVEEAGSSHEESPQMQAYGEDDEPVEWEPEPAPQADLDAQQLYDAALGSASSVLEQALAAIELTMREWLRGEQPEGFEQLVKQVSSRRQVPYKNRVLTLHEMRGQGSFEDPSPEAVRFALETLERFRKEF